MAKTRGEITFELPSKLEEKLGLEVPTKSDIILNKISSFVLNNFPNLTNKIMGLSKGDIAKILYKDKKPGSYQLFNCFYDYDPSNPVDFLDKVLQESPAAKASRNRFKLLKHYLNKIMFNADYNHLLMLSLGGGNARFEIEAIGKTQNSEKNNVYLVCVDSDKEAENDGLNIARKYGLEKNVLYINKKLDFDNNITTKYFLSEANKKWNLDKKYFDVFIEVGLNEYLNVGTKENNEIRSLYRCFYREQEKGYLITEQTGPHDRDPYLKKGLNWHCRYRTLEELKSEVAKVGYQIKLGVIEPMNITSIIIGEN